ncbi:MAG: prolipoprotein diacylglyceryl transferase [Nitriliruptorales bacterium]
MILAVLQWPILERIPVVGDLAISPHGIGIAAGFLVGGWLMIRRARARGLGADVADVSQAVQDVLFRVGIGVLVGARLFFVANHLDVYARDPLQILTVWHGGLTLLGGITGGVIAALPLIRRRGYRTALLMDSAAPAFAAGLAIGRLGDLAIGDHIGAPASGFPLAWRCTGNWWVEATNSYGFVPPQPYPSGAGLAPTQGCFAEAVYQTALFDVITGTVLFALLVVLERRTRFDGFFVTVFAYGYGISRLATDFLREDRRYLELTGSQWTVLATLAALTAWLLIRRPWQRPGRAWQRPGRAWRPSAEPPPAERVDDRDERGETIDARP